MKRTGWRKAAWCGVAAVVVATGCKGPGPDASRAPTASAETGAGKPRPMLQAKLSAKLVDDGSLGRLSLVVTPEREAEAMEVEFLLPAGVTATGGTATRFQEQGPYRAGQMRIFGLEVDVSPEVRKTGVDVMAGASLHLRGANKDTVNVMARLGPPAAAPTAAPKAGVPAVDHTGRPVVEMPAKEAAAPAP